MTRVNSSDSLAALMRVQIEAIRGKAQLGTQPNKRATRARAAQQEGPTDLATSAALRLRQISADDPDRERKAARIFLESVLLAELGSGLMEDPQFSRMVDHVQEQMATNPELARATSEAAALLLKSAQS